MPYTALEYHFVNFLNYVPFVVLFIYSFAHHLRFSKKVTALILCAATVFYFAGNHLVQDADEGALQLFTYLVIAVLVATALTIIKAHIGQMLFIALILKNCADFIVVISKFVEFQIWPENAMELYRWTYGLSMLVCEAAFMLIVLVLFKKYFSPANVDRLESQYWHHLWIIPLFFYLLWVFIYYMSDGSSLEKAITPQYCLFMLLSIACQLFIYSCTVRMVEKYLHYSKVQEDLFAAKIQTLQYKNITQHIEQTRALRHDLRHHLIVISEYLEEKNYEQLKEYVAKHLNYSRLSRGIKYCSNHILNILLVYYADQCAAGNIAFHAEMNIPENIGLNEADTTILFGNLLENAMEACLKTDGRERVIYVSGSFVQNHAVFSIANSFPEGYSLPENNIFLSSKRSEPGIGTESCKKVIERYGGVIEWTQDRFVEVKFMIPVCQAEAGS